MGWKDDIKKLLNIPEDAEIITKPYYREIPKKNGKRYRALTIQYVYQGKKHYKHINKKKEAVVKQILSREDTVIEYVFQHLLELKDFLDSVQDERVKQNLSLLYREIERLLLKLSTRIF